MPVNNQVENYIYIFLSIYRNIEEGNDDNNLHLQGSDDKLYNYWLELARHDKRRGSLVTGNTTSINAVRISHFQLLMRANLEDFFNIGLF